MNWGEWIGLEVEPEADELISAVLTAHKTAALENENVSSVALSLAASVKTAFPQSVAAALQTLGGPVHGPTKEARELIYAWSAEDVQEALNDGHRLPGWGNSFHRDQVDPAWHDVDKMLRENYEEHAARLDNITELISEVKGKVLFPNAAAYTAVTAHIIGLPLGLEIMLLIIGRLPAWAAQYMSQQNR
jgi:citrate synthase